LPRSPGTSSGSVNDTGKDTPLFSGGVGPHGMTAEGVNAVAGLGEDEVETPTGEADH
jgi:hypothetical protein